MTAQLRAWVAVREALVPLYYGDPRRGGEAGKRGQPTWPGGTCASQAVMAPVIEARAQARMASLGRHRQAEALGRARASLDRAQDELADLPPDQRADTALGYTERQLYFHMGDALVGLGDWQGAGLAFGQAAQLYSAAEVLDCALVALRAGALPAGVGRARAGAAVGRDTVLGLPRRAPTEVVAQVARALGQEAAARYPQLPALAEYRDALQGAERPRWAGQLSSRAGQALRAAWSALPVLSRRAGRSALPRTPASRPTAPIDRLTARAPCPTLPSCRSRTGRSSGGCGGGVLQRRAHLPGVQRVDSGVAVEDGEQDRRVPHACPHLVIRRVTEQPAEFLRVGRSAELVVPRLAEPEQLVPDHVEQRCRAHRGGAQFRPLGHGGTDQQAAVGSAPHGQLLAGRPARRRSASRAAAWKSSNTFCLCSRMPARCHSSPSSLPPRKPAMA